MAKTEGEDAHNALQLLELMFLKIMKNGFSRDHRILRRQK